MDGWLLNTDWYQITSANAYFEEEEGREKYGFFTLFFRDTPFGNWADIPAPECAIFAGVNTIRETLKKQPMTSEDVSWLLEENNRRGRPLSEEFMEALLQFDLSEVDIRALPEGRAVSPHQPLLTVEGPLWKGQLLESLLLTIINHETLIATKAMRIDRSAPNVMIADFGMRRAHGPQAGLHGARAAIIGGMDYTSQTKAGVKYDAPITGTHPHSYIMSHDSELEAFRNFAQTYPDDCVLLVDTYDIEQGIDNAIEVGQELQHQGHSLKGVRIDSGDLAEGAQYARQRLVEAGLEGATVFISGDLDEYELQSINTALQEPEWLGAGVGTKLQTAYEDPALGGVYKLTGVSDGWYTEYRPTIKASSTPEKATLPGCLTSYTVEDEDRLITVIKQHKTNIGRGDEVEKLNSEETVTVPEEATPTPSPEDYLYEREMGFDFREEKSLGEIMHDRRWWVEQLSGKEHVLAIEPQLKRAREAIVADPQANIEAILEGELV